MKKHQLHLAYTVKNCYISVLPMPNMRLLNYFDKHKVFKSIPVFVIGCIAFTCFFPASGYDFTNWDDNYLVTQNAAIRDISLSGIIKIFTSFSLNHYHPLVTLSYAIEYSLFGLNPFAFHLTNIILHGLNSVLVAILVRSLTKKTTAVLVTGVLFAIHPLRVESVVWIAERKDVLSALFILLSFILYIQYRRTDKQSHFYCVAASFLCALLSKAMAVTLPILFLAYDFFIDGSIHQKRLKEKIPLFLISVAFGIIAMIGQYAGGIGPKDPSFNVFSSLFLVPYGFLFYCIKFLFPFNLSPVYPYPETIGSTYPLLFWLSPLIVVVLLYCFYRFFRRDRLLVFALSFYVIAILPVLQFIPVGRMMTADRFSYVPLVGLMLILGQGFHTLWIQMQNHLYRRFLLVVVSLCIAAGLWHLTRQQMSSWQSNQTLWNRVVVDNPSYAEGYNNLGSIYAEGGSQREALNYFHQAISLDSTDAEFFHNRGLLYLQMKQWNNAIQDFSRSIELNPKDITGYTLRGNAYLQSKSYRESIDDYTHVLIEHPMACDVRIERIQALVGNGEYSAALEDIHYLHFSGVQLDSTYVKSVQKRAQTVPEQE
jgi:protein O-mannosyl-transferase